MPPTSRPADSAWKKSTKNHWNAFKTVTATGRRWSRATTGVLADATAQSLSLVRSRRLPIDRALP
jgi:hypothetical protein